MRIVHLRVEDGRRDRVFDVLDEAGVDYVETRTGDGDAILVQFPLPTEAVTEVLDAVRGAGVGEEEYTVVAAAQSARTPGFAELKERFANGDEVSIDDEELREKALDLAPGDRTYYAMTLLSAVIAAAGLLLGSPAVVVGAMVVSPQVGSAVGVAVGAVLSDTGMVRRAVVRQVVGFALAAAGTAALGVALKTTGAFPAVLDLRTIEEIATLTSPGVFTLLIGLCAGAAGGFGVSSDLPESLVGVAVAAALVPAAAAIGIGTAWGEPALAVGATVLLAVNVVSINVAATAVLWVQGYRPWDDSVGASPFTGLGRASRSPRVLAVAAVIVVLLAGPALTVADQMAFESGTNAAVSGVLTSPEYERTGLALRSTHAEFTDFGLSSGPEGVTVVLARPPDAPFPDLPGRLAAAIERRTGQQVDVTVEYVDRARSNATASTRG